MADTTSLSCAVPASVKERNMTAFTIQISEHIEHRRHFGAKMASVGSARQVICRLCQCQLAGLEVVKRNVPNRSVFDLWFTIGIRKRGLIRHFQVLLTLATGFKTNLAARHQRDRQKRRPIPMRTDYGRKHAGYARPIPQNRH